MGLFNVLSHMLGCSSKKGTTEMSKVAIVYFSGYGHTKKLTEAVAAGVEKAASAQLVAISQEGELAEADWATLLAADAIIFGAPTYMGNAPWQFKKFADASSKYWGHQQWKNKIAAGFTNSASMNGDKLATLHSIYTLAMQHSMIWVGLGLMAANKKASVRNDINYVGSFSGLMATSPADSSPEEGPLPGDLETAKLFGQRVAEITNKFVK